MPHPHFAGVVLVDARQQFGAPYQHLPTRPATRGRPASARHVVTALRNDEAGSAVEAMATDFGNF
ncbi:hypothetical protein [Nocardia sp. NPDC051463]|uniref:hypothetical protein n=1 Tax=Nocardia sp. NPDC051463 TaxID=3154845 RepID=UPI003431D322